MAGMSSIRRDIEQAMGATFGRRSKYVGEEAAEGETKAGKGSKGAKKRKKPGTRGQPEIVRISGPHKDGRGEFKYLDDKGNWFRKTVIDGKQYMQREDGAVFKIRKDGRWQHTIPARKKRRKGLFG